MGWRPKDTGIVHVGWRCMLTLSLSVNLFLIGVDFFQNEIRVQKNGNWTTLGAVGFVCFIL